MNEPFRSPDSDSGPRLLRAVLVIVFAGAALGLGSNWIQRLSGSSRALPLIATESKLAKLETLPAALDSSAGSTPSAIATNGAAADRATTNSAPSSMPPASAHAVAPEAHRVAVANPVAPNATSRSPGANSDSAGPTSKPPQAAPSSPPAAASSAATPSLPAIPDTREPLEVNYATVKALHDAGAALFVDARSAEEYAEGHIPGAVDLPFDDVFKKPELAKSLDTRGRPIVTYCGGGDCELSKSLAFSLIEAGQKKVLVFTGGLPGWKDAGNRIATGPSSPGGSP